MSLGAQLSEQVTKLEQVAPEPILKTINKARADFAATFDPSKAIKVGDKLPSFTLTNALEKPVSSSELLAKGDGLLITFYRGDWCPFCNLALGALQKKLPELESRGVTLVAITPELPSTTMSTTEKQEIKFPVLSDVDNKLAYQMGIAYEQPDELRSVYSAFGHDMKARTGNDSLVVPVPATLLVDKTGVVRNVFLDSNYTKRVEPDEVLKWIDTMKN